MRKGFITSPLSLTFGRTATTSFAGSYTLSSELIDLEKEATIIAAKEDYDGSDKALKTAIDKLVEKIVKVETEVNGEIASKEKPKKQESKAPNSNSKDTAACEYARKKNQLITWRTYLDKYPNGECAAEANDSLDSMACKNAEKRNTVQGWGYSRHHRCPHLPRFHSRRDYEKKITNPSVCLRGRPPAKTCHHLKST